MFLALVYQSVYFAEGVTQQTKKGGAQVAFVSATPNYQAIQSVKSVQLALLYHVGFLPFTGE